jgi:DNA helicase HerA-like ATPase
VILNLADVSEGKRLQIIAYYILKKMFSMRKISAKEGKKIIPPCVVFIEEAHNFAPKYFHSEMSMAKWQIEKIAREGRKFNLGLCLITQRPSHLSQTALSQCNTQIILRITNPNDHMFIQDTSEHIDFKTIKNISSLSVGEGILIGEAVNAPVFVKFRKAKTSEAKLNKSMEEEADDFEKNDEEITDAYL